MNTADLRMGESKLNTNHSKFPKNPLLLIPKTTVHAYNGLEVVLIWPTSSSPASASPTNNPSTSFTTNNSKMSQIDFFFNQCFITYAIFIVFSSHIFFISTTSPFFNSKYQCGSCSTRLQSKTTTRLSYYCWCKWSISHS